MHGTFYAGDIVDLKVTYTVTATEIDPGAETTAVKTVTFSLPD